MLASPTLNDGPSSVGARVRYAGATARPSSIPRVRLGRVSHRSADDAPPVLSSAHQARIAQPDSLDLIDRRQVGQDPPGGCRTIHSRAPPATHVSRSASSSDSAVESRLARRRGRVLAVVVAALHR